jgi:hypothetical protein
MYKDLIFLHFLVLNYNQLLFVQFFSCVLQKMLKCHNKKFLNTKGYFLASKTFLTSIYIRKDVIKKLPSKYVKEIRR